eukprot:6792888-Prymnesium_polylepis.2
MAASPAASTRAQKPRGQLAAARSPSAIAGGPSSRLPSACRAHRPRAGWQTRCAPRARGAGWRDGTPIRQTGATPRGRPSPAAERAPARRTAP